MKRRRATARFWVFLLIVAAAIGFAVWKLWPFGSSQTLLMMAESKTSMELDVVYVRDETVYLATSVSQVDFVAEEGRYLDQGDTVCHVFTTGYTENLLAGLDDIREDIQTYHTELLGNIIDIELETLNDVVSIMGGEVRDLAQGTLDGSLRSAIRKLETAMTNRQDYMRQNQQSDSKLIQFYQEESTQLSSIASMRKTALATASGVVSFQLDGYERDLTPDTVMTLTEADMRAVIKGTPLTNTSDTLTYGLFRMVKQSDWYVAALYTGDAWTPVVGQEYNYTPVGYDDLQFRATVSSVQKVGDTIVVTFHITEPMGYLLYQRHGRGSFSTDINGFSVNSNAICDNNGQTGIWVVTDEGETFVEVDVLTNDGGVAIITPRIDGALQFGQRIAIR